MFLYSFHLNISCFVTFIVIYIFQCSEECPLILDNSTQCTVNYGDIKVTFTLQMPMFINNGLEYRSVDLSKLDLRFLPKGAFMSLKVKRITLNFNKFGSEIHDDSFIGVNNILEELGLANCGIYHLRPEILGYMRNLKVLHLWNNHIKEISAMTFRDTSRLEELYLWGNNIERLQEHMFAGLSKLRRLDLDKNGIKEINNNTFNHLKKLEVLYLGNNNIVTIHGHTFSHLSNLKILDLKKNGLKYIYDDAFRGLYKLLVLNLENNKLSLLMDQTFQDMENLKILWLQDNEVSMLWTQSFVGLIALQRLHLSGNKIESLRKGVFKHSSKLKILTLDKNMLHSIHKCIFSKSTRLKSLTLSGNPLHCDCRLTWLIDLVNKDVNIWGTCGVAGKENIISSIADPSFFKEVGCQFPSADCHSL